MIQKDTNLGSIAPIINSVPEVSYCGGRNCSGATTFSHQPRRIIRQPIMPYSALPSFPIGDWGAWSMKPHTTDEIRKRLITKPIDHTCISYICRYSKIDADFFEEFAVLTSGLFHSPDCHNTDLIINQPITYTSEAVQYFISVFKHGYFPNEEILPVPQSIKDDMAWFSSAKRGNKSFPSLVQIYDRLDWFYLGQHQHWPAQIYAQYLPQFTKAAVAEQIKQGVLESANDPPMEEEFPYANEEFEP